MAFVHISTAAQQSCCDAFVDLIDAGAGSGYVEIYAADGDGVPANANTAITDQTLLGTLTFSDPAFGDANSSGVATASSITGDTSADASGTAAWARIYDSDDNVICDVDVGATSSGKTIELNSTTIVAGGTIDITAFTFTMPSGV